MFGFFSSMYLQEHLGIELPWWGYSVAMLLLMCLLGIESVEVGGRVLGVLMLMEVGIMLVVDIAVLLSHDTPPLTLEAFSPGVINQGSIGIALIFSIAAFIGFESTAIYGEECRNRKKRFLVRRWPQLS